jgi:integrase
MAGRNSGSGSRIQRAARLTGLQRQHGGAYIYHRASGLRMPDLPETHPDFLRAYLAAEQHTSAPPSKARAARRDPGSLAHLWDSLQRTAYFMDLSENYRRTLQPHGDAIAARGAGVPVDQLRPRHIRADLSQLAPHAAGNRLKAWRAICRHAIGCGLIDTDPAAAVARPQTPRAQPYPVWPAAALAAYRSCWPLGCAQRLAFELIQFTGARIVDAVRLGPPMIDADGGLSYVQQKTRQPVWLPWSCPLPPFADPAARAHLHAAIAATPPPGPVWIVTQSGAPRSAKAASSWISTAARAAGLDADLTAHGLRATRASDLAERGASARQIGAWTGHTSLAETDHYSRQADRKALLRGAPD